jgi:hypothetical protein
MTDLGFDALPGHFQISITRLEGIKLGGKRGPYQGSQDTSQCPF